MSVCFEAAFLLDVMLPNRDGFEILQDLRTRPETQDLPILMLTAKGQEKDRAAAQSYGATRFMTKPFSNEQIVQAMRNICGV